MTQLVTIHGVRGFISSDGLARLNLEDVARGLGFTQKAASGNEVVRWERVNKYLSEFGFIPTSGDGGFIPENIFYRLAMRAKNNVAESFQEKVANEILPSIRRTGMYATAELLDNPDLLIEAATRLKKEREERLKLQAKIEQDKPKVVFAEALEVSKDSILVADLAKLLKQNGFEIGEIRLFEWLRQNGYLIKSGSERNMPTQRSMELKIMEIKMGQRMSSSEGSKITRTTKITGKGQIYFINKFKEGA
ncbi:phage antirepressor KilAC domain-containing protein [Paenibacillus kribbensis]|uniref:phage antirepressor KilAC domain-containing protein n=1 Tax=Paenibacillus kribbensis TaxID=172713 RepID=UPI00083931F2|nr:phage antirepressor KilAC domain-containing protein [Paenibacillus kribbensis]